MPAVPTIPCPICNGPVSFDAPEMPFCSKRCRMIDIGNWADERYVISSPASSGEMEEELGDSDEGGDQ